jgi:integrase/recombinase XerD
MFERFIKEKRYLVGLSERTIECYGEVYKRWEKYAGGLPDADKLLEFVTGMREAGLSVVTINLSIRSFNSYLTWLHENGHIPAPLRLKKLKEEKRAMKTFSDEAFKKFLSWRPGNRREWRFYALFCLLADTGVRVSEAMNLLTPRVDFDNLLITVTGKGSRQRVVPMSIELRKVLWTYLTKHRRVNFPSDYFFATRSGTPMTYHNLHKIFRRVCGETGVDYREIDGAFHAFRRKFGREYLKHGGNVLYLQRIFGHSDLQTTKLYIEVEAEDLKAVHLKTSPLSRLK